MAAQIFPIAPLIRITLLSLYGTLLLPLPLLAAVTDAPLPPWLLPLGTLLGFVVLYGALSERVILDQEGMAVTYPAWIRWLLRRGWQLQWSQLIALTPRTTGQGGLVYYCLSHDQHAYLLPMRVAGFSRLVQQIEAHTGIDTRDIKPLAQPWMYLLLLGFTGLLLLVDAWTLWMAWKLGELF